MLFSQGVSDYEPLRRNRRQRLDELKTGDGRPLPPHLKGQINRELDRLELLLGQIKAVEAERGALLAPTAKTEQSPAPQAILIDLRGIGPELSAILWSEGLYRSLPTESRSRRTQAWRRHLGKAAPSRTSKACPKPAIRGCGQQ